MILIPVELLIIFPVLLILSFVEGFRRGKFLGNITGQLAEIERTNRLIETLSLGSPKESFYEQPSSTG